MTINSIIEKLKAEPIDDPKTLSDMVVQLSASLYTACEIESDLEVNAAKKLEEIRNSAEMSDKRAETKLKLTEEWRDWQRARNTNKCVVETLRGIKRKLRNLEVIYSEGKF